MKPLPLSLAAWTCTAATAFLLSRSNQPLGYASLFVLPAVSVALTIFSRGGSATNAAFRITWWIFTLATWLAVALFATGRWERSSFAADDRQQLLVAGGIMWIVAVWSIVRARAFPTRRTWIDLSAASAIVAAIAGGVLWQQESRTRELEEKAKARWNEVGTPMDSFAQALKPVPANKALGTLGAVLRELVDAGAYAPREPLPQVNTPPAVLEAVEVVTRPLPVADDISTAEISTPKLDALSNNLTAVYERLLANESPIWAANPADHWRMQMPNLVAIRKFVQLVSADAIRRVEQGDAKGARMAIKAAKHVTAKLPENPSISSLMVRVALDELIAKAEVRLPAEPGALEQIAADARRFPEALENAIRMETWSLSRVAELADAPIVAPNSWVDSLRLPSWVTRIMDGPNLRRDCLLSAIVNAEFVAILKDPTLVKTKDLGMARFDSVIQQNAAPFILGVQRSYARIWASLLLREQTELLRIARERIATGQAPEDRDSVVLPGRRWIFTADSNTNAVSLKLDKIPVWLGKNEIAPPSFWVLPLDGSKTWQFRSAARSAAR